MLAGRRCAIPGSVVTPRAGFTGVAVTPGGGRIVVTRRGTRTGGGG